MAKYICGSHFVLVPCIIACLLHVLYSPAVNIKTSSNIMKLSKAAQVAFFKVGKFYEIFYYDAFIAQRVCGLKWMSQDKSLGWMTKGTPGTWEKYSHVHPCATWRLIYIYIYIWRFPKMGGPQ